MKELKIKIDDAGDLEKRLRKAGGTFLEEKRVTDTYFHQPDGRVLKIVENDTGTYLVHLHAKNGNFVIDKRQNIDNPQTMKDDLNRRYGIKRVMTKERRFWDVGGTQVNLNIFDDIGSFLIIEAEQPDPAFVTDMLGIAAPEYVTVAFCDYNRLQE